VLSDAFPAVAAKIIGSDPFRFFSSVLTRLCLLLYHRFAFYFCKNYSFLKNNLKKLLKSLKKIIYLMKMRCESMEMVRL